MVKSLSSKVKNLQSATPGIKIQVVWEQSASSYPPLILWWQEEHGGAQFWFPRHTLWNDRGRGNQNVHCPPSVRRYYWEWLLPGRAMWRAHIHKAEMMGVMMGPVGWEAGVPSPCCRSSSPSTWKALCGKWGPHPEIHTGLIDRQEINFWVGLC